MAKFFESAKRRKRLTAALCGVLSITLSMGIISACTTSGDDDETSKTPSTPTDTQLLKNGNFEFYGEMTKKFEDKRAFINSPSSYNWSFSSGSPASESASGIVNAGDEWKSITTRKIDLIQTSDRALTDDDGNPVEHAELSEAAYDYADAHWEEANIYDRLEFYDFYEIDSKDEFARYKDYNYSIKFADVKYLHDEVGTLELYDETKLELDTPETGVLMIHNRAESYSVQGTAQYYTSGTTLTLAAGTAAEVSVWVKTANLRHYHKDNEDPVSKRAGAYIGVTQTVGGVTLDQMQIKNIITENDPEAVENNGWKQYTIYIRANTFASTTFRLVLGLGQGSSDNRYEAVNGYAFFDDVECKIISTDKFDDAVKDNGLVKTGENGNFCDLNSRADDKKFYATTRTTGEITNDTYAIDLSADFDAYNFEELATVDLTKTRDGSQDWTSDRIDSSLGDTRFDTTNTRRNVGAHLTYDEISNLTKTTNASYNGYLKTIFENDFEGKFPFSDAAKNDIILLLSTNGAAYTATLPEVKVEPNSRMLFSFYVKTSEILSGRSGAGATLIDGTNKISITPFDTTAVATVDIDKDSDDPDQKDIYKGWVQCFFFVENTTDSDKFFHVELTYGPTAIAGTTKSDYSDGYAAFANFRTATLTKTQYGYAATGTYAQKTTLTSAVKDTTAFDSAAASGTPLEKGLATPANYTGVQAGSNVLVENGNSNPNRDELAEQHFFSGLLSAQYAQNYFDLDAAWKSVLNTAAKGATDGDSWWTNIFGNKGSAANVAYQPLVMMNAGSAALPSYGYVGSKQTVSSTTAIRVRVKLSAGAKATLYLIDLNDEESEIQLGLATTIPAATYWYDDDGNIVNMDPGSDEYDDDGYILYELQPNGLYKKAGDNKSDTYYANLAAYKELDGNLVTSDETIVFYGRGGSYYYYYDEETDTYDTRVNPLPDSVPTRYGKVDNSKYAAAIEVVGDEKNADQWTTVTFFVKAGKTAKNYRLELWAGARDNATDGIPAGGYVFFDRVTNPSVTFADQLNTAVEALKREAGLKADQNLTEYDAYKDLALYYTFTFFDSVDYTRYDADMDEDNLGNPWKNFKQSDYSEQLAYLYVVDEDGSLLDSTGPTVSKFIDFSASETAVERAVTGSTGSGSNSGSTNDDDDDNGDGYNFWLSLASILLVVALVFAVLVVLVRRAWKKHHKSNKPSKKAPAKKAAPLPKAKETVEETEPETVETPADENDPYNE